MNERGQLTAQEWAKKIEKQERARKAARLTRGDIMTTEFQYGQAPPASDIVLLEGIPSPEQRAMTASLYLDLVKVWGDRVREIRDDAIVEMLAERKPADVARTLRLGTTLIATAPGRVAKRRLQQFGDSQEQLVEKAP